MLNHIVLMGRLTRDVELRTTQSGVSVASFTLACDRDFGGRDGEKETDFIDCVAWRSTADFAAKYFSKGRMAVVSGRLQIRPWTDKEGNKRYSTEVAVRICTSEIPSPTAKRTLERTAPRSRRILTLGSTSNKNISGKASAFPPAEYGGKYDQSLS
jgi:single stranded DNA-binding protein